MVTAKGSDAPEGSRTESGATIVLLEPRDFTRACLTCWLDAAFSELKVHSVPDLAGLSDSVLPASVAVILIRYTQQGVGWLQSQVNLMRASRPDVPFVVLADADDLSAAEALARELDLQGCLLTSSSEKVAAAILRLVIVGGAYFPSVHDRTQSLARDALNGPVRMAMDTATIAALTKRELAILRLLRDGMQNKIIAHRLGISLSTVKTHIHRVIRKLHLRNRTEAALAAWNIPLDTADLNGSTPHAAMSAMRLSSNTASSASL